MTVVMDDVVARLDRIDVPLRGVARFVRMTNAPERAPRSDVVPAEIAGQDNHAVAAFEDADVDRDRRDGAEERVDVVGVRMEGRTDLGREPANVVEEVADLPDKDP